MNEECRKQVRHRVIEELCDIAAAELLMPTTEFQRWAKTLSVDALAATFKVSRVAVMVKMHGGQVQKKFVGNWHADYDAFDRAGFIESRVKEGKPVLIVWVSNTKRLRCRDYMDVHGVSDLLGVVEVPTLFSGSRESRYKEFLIPYLLTGYDVPPELEEDCEKEVWGQQALEKFKEAYGEEKYAEAIGVLSNVPRKKVDRWGRWWKVKGERMFQFRVNEQSWAFPLQVWWSKEVVVGVRVFCFAARIVRKEYGYVLGKGFALAF